MNKEFNKIQKFTDLVAWQEGHNLVLMVYRETKNFPAEEKYGLIDQMRRAAVSITSNIAEGFSKKSSKEKHQFYTYAQASVTELQGVGYCSKEIFNKIAQQSIITNKLLSGLLKAKRYES